MTDPSIIVMASLEWSMIRRFGETWRPVGVEVASRMRI